MPQPTEYRGAKLATVSDGKGGSLPVALTGHENDGAVFVVCLHPESHTNWVFETNAANIRSWTWGKLTPAMKHIIKSRITAC